MLEGKPLSWTASRCCCWAATAGCTSSIPKLAKEAQKTSPRFFGYSPSEMKTALQQEFDKQFDVSTTRHYLVVHPHGERDQWADRFEDLYKRFEHYFRVRGFSLEEPPYPLVAVVFRDQAEYYRHAAASGTPMRPEHARPLRSRLEPRVLFDVTAGSERRRLVGKRRHDHPRGDAPNGVQRRRPQAIHGRAALAGRRAGDDVRGPRRVERAVRSHAGRPREPRPAD